MMDLNNIENLVLAETKDHWNWDMLAAVARKIEDAELKRMALKAIGEVRKQEKLHLDWNEQTLSTLAKESAMKASTKLRTRATLTHTLAEIQQRGENCG